MKWLCAVSGFLVAGSMAFGQAKEKKDWCDPSLWSGISYGYHRYHCVPDPTSPNPHKMGHVEEDKQAEEWAARAEAHKNELAQAMTTRVLTLAEYTEALSMGSDLLTHPMQPYFQTEVDARFEHMLRIQDELRRAAEKPCGDKR